MHPAPLGGGGGTGEIPLLLTVGTFNSPHRLLPHAADYDVLADRYQCDVVLGQENTDNDPEKNCSDNWTYYRPVEARSNAIYWNPDSILASDNGCFQLSSPGFNSERWLVWQHFLKDGHHARIASVHLPAFYNKYPKNKVEYDKQEPKVAEWLEGGKHRILGGDLNGKIGNRRLRHLTKAGRWSKPVPSGPAGQPIDYVGSSIFGNWYPIKTRVHKPSRSDHNAVVVTFEWRK